MVDFKCGKCESVFTIDLEKYQARYANNAHIICPSCLCSAPDEIRSIVIQLFRHKEYFEGWTIGTRYHETHRCK